MKSKSYKITLLQYLRYRSNNYTAVLYSNQLVFKTITMSKRDIAFKMSAKFRGQKIQKVVREPGKLDKIYLVD